MKRNTKAKRELIAARREAADVISVAEAALRLGIGKNQAYAAVQMGYIPALRFGRRWLIPRIALDSILRGERSITPDRVVVGVAPTTP